MKPAARPLAAAVIAIAAASLTGCLRIQQGITLAKDLSGTASFSMEMNMEPMATFMAGMQRTMAGQQGPPTAAQIEAARRDLLKQKKDERKTPAEARAEVEKDLPEGLRLLDLDLVEEGLKTRMRIELAFDHVSKLKRLSVTDDPDDPVSDPFGGLEVREEADRVIVEARPLNPMREVEEKAARSPAGAMGDLDAQIRSAFADMSIEFRIESAFDVVDHNATVKRGNTLIWRYDMATLQKLGDAADPGIRVVFAR